MNFQKNLKGLMFLHMFGFFVGNIYANLFAKEYILMAEILNEYSRDCYALTEIDTKRYMMYILPLRIVPAVILCVFGRTRFRKIVAFLFLVWTGFLSGIIVAASIIKMGVFGTIFTIIVMFPHMILYIAAYYILLGNICKNHHFTWNYSQILAAFVVICIGIFTECYVNPGLVKLFLKTV